MIFKLISLPWHPLFHNPKSSKCFCQINQFKLERWLFCSPVQNLSMALLWLVNKAQTPQYVTEGPYHPMKFPVQSYFFSLAQLELLPTGPSHSLFLLLPPSELLFFSPMTMAILAHSARLQMLLSSYRMSHFWAQRSCKSALWNMGILFFSPKIKMCIFLLFQLYSSF